MFCMIFCAESNAGYVISRNQISDGQSIMLLNLSVNKIDVSGINLIFSVFVFIFYCFSYFCIKGTSNCQSKNKTEKNERKLTVVVV